MAIVVKPTAPFPMASGLEQSVAPAIEPQVVAQVLRGVLAVETHAPELPGPTKLAIVLGQVQTVAGAVPTIVNLVSMFVNIFNAAGLFKGSRR